MSDQIDGYSDQFDAYGSSTSSVGPNSNYGPALVDFDWPMLAGHFYQQQQPDKQQHQQHQQVVRQTISQPPCVTQASYDIPSTTVVDDDGHYTTDLSGSNSLGRPGVQGSPSKRTRGIVKCPTSKRDYTRYQRHDRGESTSIRNRLGHMSQRRSASPDHIRGDTSCSVEGDEWSSDEEAVLREVRRLDHFQRHVRYSAAMQDWGFPERSPQEIKSHIRAKRHMDDKNQHEVHPRVPLEDAAQATTLPERGDSVMGSPA